jgi:hypothetical protein
VDFEGLRREVAPPVIERLKRTYAHVDDIDLFTGNQIEKTHFFFKLFQSLS